MNIKLVGKNILFKGSNAALLIKRSKDKVDFADYQVVVDITAPSNDNKVIGRPGEYEISDILVYALDTAGKIKIDVVAVDIDGIKVIYLTDSKTIDIEKTLDEVGICDIVLAEFVEDNLTIQTDNVNEIDPNILVPLTNSADVLKNVLKEYGNVETEPKPTLKVSQTDFSAEESNIVIELLK